MRPCDPAAVCLDPLRTDYSRGDSQIISTSAASPARRRRRRRSTTSASLDCSSDRVGDSALRCHAWCYSESHPPPCTSPTGNLSKAMHWFGSCTAQTFNTRHERSGHLFQGRFGSRLVEDQPYFLELARYVALNPFHQALCATPDDWPWSSYAATAGLRERPRYLDPHAGCLRFSARVRRTPPSSPPASIRATPDWSMARRGRRRAPPLEVLLRDDSDRAIALAHFRHGYSKVRHRRPILASAAGRSGDASPGLASAVGVGSLGVRPARRGSDPRRAGQTPFRAPLAAAAKAVSLTSVRANGPATQPFYFSLPYKKQHARDYQRHQRRKVFQATATFESGGLAVATVVMSLLSPMPEVEVEGK